jgi:hypothetical protein
MSLLRPDILGNRLSQQVDRPHGVRPKGLLAASGPRRRNVGAAGYLPRKPMLCPDCLRTRQIPVVRVSGHVPELLVAALAEGAEIAEISPDVGPVFSFQAVVRVA